MSDPSTSPSPSDPPPPGPLERLSLKLAGFQDQLEDDEADLLSGLLAVAADTLGHSGAGPGHTDLVEVDDQAESAAMRQGATAPQLGPQLLQQFTTAFTADAEGPDRSRPFIIPAPPRTSPSTFIIIP